LKSPEALENPVDSITDPVVMIWQARNLLAELEMFPATDEISQILAETEMTLFNLILRIVAIRKVCDKPRLELISSSDICR
jgi:hypothetical protein